MATANHGRAGLAWVDDQGSTSRAVGSMTAWSYEATADETETTAMGDTAKTYLGGLQAGSGKISCMWVQSDVGQLAIVAAVADGDPVSIIVHPNGTDAGHPKYTGDVVFKSYAVDSSKDSVITFTADFRGFLTLGTQ